MRMESVTFVPQGKHGIMDDDDDHHHRHHHHEEEEDDIGSLSPFSKEEDDEGSSNSVASSSSDFMEDASSSGSSSNGPLFEMSSLISQLPFKRGLSKHFEGKSQSFTSLSYVKSLEDLIKSERPFKKRLNSSKSYGWGLDKSLSPKSSSRAITKKSSKGSYLSSLSNNNMKRHSILGSRPPFPPQRSGSLSGQTLLETIG